MSLCRGRDTLGTPTNAGGFFPNWENFGWAGALRLQKNCPTCYQRGGRSADHSRYYSGDKATHEEAELLGFAHDER